MTPKAEESSPKPGPWAGHRPLARAYPPRGPWRGRGRLQRRRV